MGKLYVRVDDRLIHGQTIVAWCPTLKIDEIIAIDDVSAKNPMLKSILTMSVPKNYKADIVTTDEAKEMLATHQYKVYEVAEATGFSNYAYFYQAYRKYTGLSPKNT